MIIVIQCAAKKRSDAGFLQTIGGKRVFFVADPGSAPTDDNYVYAHPDGVSDRGHSWRDALLAYNRETRDNPLGLCPAYQLYENRTYRRLVDRFGTERTYILSAGWGLIRADFLTPYYDITFSQSAENYKRRSKKDRYGDFCMLPDGFDEQIVFFGGKAYVPLFCSLTTPISATRVVFYNSAHPPDAPGCRLQRFETTTRTNWHYECANAFLDGVM